MGSEAKYKKDDWMINLINFDDDSVSHFNSNSNSFPEIYRVRPIRSDRQPKKMKKLLIDDENGISSYAAMEVTKVVNTSIKNGENAETSCPDNQIGTRLL
ncbi:hypothetical protein ACFW04_003810 [Cataglyphis niger]